MAENWTRVYSCGFVYKAEIVKAVLADNSIDSVIVNKQDSSYFIGDVEVNVHSDDAIRALQIIENEQL
jgi:hypothetical protein